MSKDKKMYSHLKFYPIKVYRGLYAVLLGTMPIEAAKIIPLRYAVS